MEKTIKALPSALPIEKVLHPLLTLAHPLFSCLCHPVPLLNLSPISRAFQLIARVTLGFRRFITVFLFVLQGKHFKLSHAGMRSHSKSIMALILDFRSTGIIV